MSQPWISAKLKDCFKLKSGENLTAKNMIAGEYPVFGGNSQAGTHNDFNLSGDNVIVGRVGALCGNARHFTENIWLTDNAFKITQHKFNFDNRFLTYLLNFKNLRQLARQAAQPVISNSSLADLELSFPESIEVQKQIVAKLDQALADIEKAKMNAEQNLKNAKELFDSYLEKVFNQAGNGWSLNKLEDLSELITKGSSPKWQGFEYIEEPEVLFVTSENVGANKMLYKKEKYLEKAFNVKEKKSTLKKGDVLTNIVGASIGRTAIFDRDVLANINQAVCLIRCKPSLLLNEYLSYLLNSPYFIKILHDNEIDNARANLSLGFFRLLVVPTPSLEKQKDIIDHAREFEKQASNLTNIYQEKLNSLEELKQSILQKAFNGELA